MKKIEERAEFYRKRSDSMEHGTAETMVTLDVIEQDLAGHQMRLEQILRKLFANTDEHHLPLKP